MFRMQLPPVVSEILHTLQTAGHEAYVVGGCVRDSLMGKTPDDWDITTSALPGQVKSLFLRTLDTGIQHGTVTVMLRGQGYEITTYRVDGEYEDGRHPREVTFTGSLEEDLKRRDFTINAMAYNKQDGLIDLFDGRSDLEQGVIRAVGDPRERFSEDALRMLRAIRFAARLGFEVEAETLKAIRDLSESLSRISAERIQAELVKLLVSPHPEKIKLCYTTSLTSVFLPEFDRVMITEQNNPHHCYTVGEHIIESICRVRADKVLRLTMLFHDLGKPACRTTDEQGVDHFKGHPSVSAGIAAERLRKLKFDNATIGDVKKLTEAHDIRIEPTEKSVRRLLGKLGERLFFLLLEVQEADILAQSMYLREQKLERQNRVRELAEGILKRRECFALKDLAINGSDLIRLGYDKGPIIGEQLHKLLERVIEEPALNDRQSLLKMAARDLGQNSGG